MSGNGPWFRTAAVIFTLTFFAGLSAASPPPLPSDDDVQRQVDAKEYKLAAEQLERLVKCRGAAAQRNDRSRDLQLLIECRLQLHQRPQLVATLKEAIDHALDANDLDALGKTAELELLVEASVNWVYHPKTNRAASYDLTDPAQREAAGPLIYAESLAAVKEAWRKAQAGRNLGPVVDLAGRFALVRATEHATTGGTAETDALGRDVEQGVGRLVGQRLTSMNGQLTNIRKNANNTAETQSLQAGGNAKFTNVHHKRLLSADDIRTVQGIEAECLKIAKQIDAINRGMASPLELGNAEPTTDDVRQKAADLLSDPTLRQR